MQFDHTQKVGHTTNCRPIKKHIQGQWREQDRRDPELNLSARNPIYSGTLRSVAQPVAVVKRTAWARRSTRYSERRGVRASSLSSTKNSLRFRDWRWLPEPRPYPRRRGR